MGGRMSGDLLPENQWGPFYDLDSATLKKYRRKVNGGGVMDLPVEERRAYGEAVERAVLAQQRTLLLRDLPPANPKVNCASGTSYGDGERIHEAVRRQQASALLNCPGQIRRARTPEQWAEMYAEAMKEKRA